MQGLQQAKLTISQSIWDAGVIMLNDETSWKVFLGTSIALTVAVFASWLLYHFIGRKQRTRIYDFKLEQFEHQGFSSRLAQEQDWASPALDDDAHYPRSRYPSAELPRDERIDGRW